VQVETRRELVCIDGTVHDVSRFIEEHPGGSSLMRSFIGKDGSAAFSGRVYNHSKTAWNVLCTMRIAVLRDYSEEG
jgi:stearoyl-CoA desaturase (delta-9 desaturase)